MWKVELRNNCKICGNPLPNARYRTFCSKACRIKSNNKKQKDSGYNVNWQREKRAKVKHSLSPCGVSPQGV